MFRDGSSTFPQEAFTPDGLVSTRHEARQDEDEDDSDDDDSGDS